MLFATASGLLDRRRHARAAMFVTFLVSFFTLAMGQEQIIRIARISLVEGEVSYQRAGDSNKDWSDATPNLPINERDQIYSGPSGRAEVQLSGRNLVRVDSNTNLRFTQFNTGTTQFALPVGTATFRVDSLDRRQFQIVDANDAGKDDPVYFEVDTPIVAITFLKEGSYRINVRDDGSTEVIVRRGQAEVYNQEIGTVAVKQGRRILIDGRDANYFQIARLEDKDNWDRWNDRRDDELFARVSSSQSARYVPVAVPGVYDLDSYGDWINTPDYGYVWYPRSVAVGWAPYRAGYWRHYSGWGWTWVSYEPWGWVPYHYGRWAYYGSRWCWVPRVNIGIGVGLGWNWSPHLVTFFGWGGGGYNRGYRDGYRDARYDFYGWCPLGPRDRYYGNGSRTIVNNTTVINNVNSLDNYNAPGGVSLMESRRFDSGRVAVNQGDLKLPPAPPRGSAGSDRSVPTIVRNEEFKPTQAAPTRELKYERAELARRVEAPVIQRRPTPEIDRSSSPGRGATGDTIGTRPTRENQAAPERANAPSRSGEASSSPTRIQNGQIIRTDRPARPTEYQSVERIPAPTREERRTPERSSPTRDAGESPRSLPGRSAEPPSRNEAPSRAESPRRYDPPPVRESAPTRESRRPDPPPVREAPPSRSERPSSPPPARESAPQRTERPSSPPPRESAPQRTERPSSPPPARESAPSRPESRPERPAGPTREKP